MCTLRHPKTTVGQLLIFFIKSYAECDLIRNEYKLLHGFFFSLFIQNTSHHSLLTHTKYTKHIFHTGPGHETHKTHKSFCSENIWNTYTQQKKFSQNT